MVIIIDIVFWQYKEKSGKSRVSLVITYHYVLKKLNSNLRNILPILYTNERMDDLYKDPPLATFKCPKEL